MVQKSTTRLTNTIDALKRYNDLLRLLMDELRDLLEGASDFENRKPILRTLDPLLVNLSQQFELEEKGGYLEDVLNRYPNWHPQVVHLRQQHALLRQQLCEARKRIATLSPGEPIGQEIQRQLVDWMNTYDEHRHRETALIQDAFALETGVGE
jgi:Hemerythrin HHE cation binding domain